MEQQFPILPTLLSFLLFIFTVLKIWKKSKNNIDSTPNLPPGPWKLPLIGNIHQLISFAPTHRRLRYLAKKYGPVMQLQLGEISTIVISSPEAAKEVMKTHDINFADRSSLHTLNTVMKGMISEPYGDCWREMRKICTMEMLSPSSVRSFRSTREEEVSNFIRLISSKVGSPINLSRMFLSLTNGITARKIIGKKIKSEEAFLSIILKLSEAGAGLSIADLFPSIKLFHIISWMRYKVKRVHQEANEILDTIINERRAKRNETNTTTNDIAEGLLDVLLNLLDYGKFEYPLTSENVKGIIMEMFLGGTDTTSTALEWAMSEMIRSPEVMSKAQKQVREVFSNKGNVEETGLHELKFLKLIIKETLRLHPPVILIPRTSKERCQINGYDIHSGSRVMINPWAFGRDPDYWTEPDKFYPERFLDSSTDYKGTNFELLPFGSGKRICPGISFAMAIIELTLAQLLYHFDWKLPNGVKNENLDMSEAFGGIAMRKQHLNLIPIPYSPSTVG